jgi:hypothetical protein
MYDKTAEEINLFVITPFLLYFLCDNLWFDLNAIFAMVALGLSVSSMKFSYHARNKEVPAIHVW